MLNPQSDEWWGKFPPLYLVWIRGREMEEWRDISGYEGLYKISNYGNIKSFQAGGNHNEEKILKGKKHPKGYVLVDLHKDGQLKTFLVHRLVAVAFIENPNNYPYINHKDEVKDNNHSDNLEWCDAKYNFHYSIGKYKKKFYNSPKTKERKPYKYFQKVLQYDLCGNLIKEYENATQASIECGIPVHNITSVCIGRYQYSHGYVWKFKE